jgi:hypothetical protein
LYQAATSFLGLKMLLIAKALSPDRILANHRQRFLGICCGPAWYTPLFDFRGYWYRRLSNIGFDFALAGYARGSYTTAFAMILGGLGER